MPKPKPAALPKSALLGLLLGFVLLDQGVSAPVRAGMIASREPAHV